MKRPYFLSTISSTFTAVPGDLNSSGDSRFLLSVGDVLTAFQKQNQFISFCIWQETLTGAVGYDFYLIVTPASVKGITPPGGVNTDGVQLNSCPPSSIIIIHDV